jgi:hypothetical protein
MESKSRSSNARRRTHRATIVLAPLAIAAFLVGVVPSLASASGAYPKLIGGAQVRDLAERSSTLGQLNPAARQAKRLGYLPANHAQYANQKARAARRARASRALTAPVTGPLAPKIVTGRSFKGINNPGGEPPDETGAVGTTRFIELVNVNFAIYNKTSNTPATTGTLNGLAGQPARVNSFDPQIIWDPTTNRFYYAMDSILDPSHNLISFGWSKTATPTGPNSFCHYFLDFGRNFPDFPKLGDSQPFLIIGSNVFNGGGSFAGSDLAAVSKPPAGQKCPSFNSLKFDDAFPLKLGATNRAFTPTPANEIDTKANGWAVARSGKLPATKLGLFKITRASNGKPVIPTTATQLTVPSYDVPANAPQKGSVNKLDTSDASNTQAVAAVDPGHNNKFALWTQHTIFGGAGAQVRWYEIDPAAHSVLQKGTVTSGSLFEFNGAISPNRRVNGATKQGGNAMLMNFNTSSAGAFPAIKMVSKVGGGAQSGQVPIKTGRTLSGGDCARSTKRVPCRWGDYASATPDPSTADRIWNVSQYGDGAGSGKTGPATSRTWIFLATP